MAALELTRWTELAPLPQPRAHCAVAAWNGKLLVAGGTSWHGGRKIWSARVDQFDPEANRWESLPALPRPHAEGAGFLLDGGWLILAGGADGAMARETWRYRDGAWQSDPAVPPPAPGRCPAAAAVGATVYLIGGFSGPTGMDSATRTVRAWTPGAKAWEERMPLPGSARFWPGVAVWGGRIFAVGGATTDRGAVKNLADIIAYDPAADRWSPAGRLPQACRGASCVAEDGEILVIGGYDGGFRREILAFQPETGRSRPAGSLPRGLAFSSFLRLGRRIIGVGGEDGDQQRAGWTPLAADRG